MNLYLTKSFTYHCATCLLKFTSYENLMIHIKIVHDKVFFAMDSLNYQVTIENLQTIDKINTKSIQSSFQDTFYLNTSSQYLDSLESVKSNINSKSTILSLV